MRLSGCQGLGCPWVISSCRGQVMNCAYIVEVWKIGGLGQKDVEEGFREVMDDGKVKESLLRLNELSMGKEASLSSTAG